MSRVPERCYSLLESEHQPDPPSEARTCQILPMNPAPTSPFDSLETSFFQEGDDLSAEAMAADSFDGPTVVYRRKPRMRKRTLFVFLGVTLLAACTTLAVSRREHSSPSSRPLSTTNTQSLASATNSPTTTVQYLAPSLPSPTTTTPNLALTLSPATAPALPESLPSPSSLPTGAVAAFSDNTTLSACKQAYEQRRAKDVVAICAQAFAANPQSVDVALMLAKTEFERGRVRPAFDWANKTIALDANRADAYVFLGGAEQTAGHNAAAKVAYKRYLQLSPRGRYASELRTVLGSI